MLEKKRGQRRVKMKDFKVNEYSVVRLYSELATAQTVEVKRFGLVVYVQITARRLHPKGIIGKYK